MAVGEPDSLGPDPLGTEVGVLSPQLGGALPGGSGELGQRMGGELGIDTRHGWQPIPPIQVRCRP
jgi:hypothetical protein